MTPFPHHSEPPRDGVGWVFVSAAFIEGEAAIPSRTTLYGQHSGSHERPAVTATTLATTTPPTPWRRGITVFTREIIPGDHIMDRGVVREVANVSVAEGSNGNSLVNFEPMDGYPPTLCVPNRTQVYVRRACRNEHEAPPMPVVDDTMRTLFACPIEVG